MDSERKNIFLDFLSPDNWKTYPSVHSYRRNLVFVLLGSVNLAAFLTREYCLLPPAFISQSRTVLDVMKRKSRYLDERLILFPLKEGDLEEYFNKKAEEYAYVKESHQGFYQGEGKAFIRKYCDAIIHRDASLGKTIADKWLVISDNSPVWKPITKIAPKFSDRLRLVPQMLTNRGVSITLEAVKKVSELKESSMDLALNQAIQHEYIKTYLNEFDAVIIKDAPPKPINLNYYVESESRFLDYQVIYEILKILGLSEYILTAEAEEILALRLVPNYEKFIKLIQTVCDCLNSRMEIRSYFSTLMGAVVKQERQYNYSYLMNLFSNDTKRIDQFFSSILEMSEKIPIPEKPTKTDVREKQLKGVNVVTNEIFLVHGRDVVKRDEVEMMLRRVGLEPIILANTASGGSTIIEKLEKHTDVAAAVILYTGCDEGRLKGATTLLSRARQNVVFEHGFLVAKLGRDKVVALVESGVETPGDVSGVVYISLSCGDWKQLLMRELKNIGFDGEWTKA